MARLFDSHAHYIDSRFEREAEGGVDGLLSTLLGGQVEGIVNVATNVADAERVIAMARRYEGMYAAVGIHPGDMADSPDIDADLAALERLIADREANGIVALGEIGLDYYWQPVDKEGQALVFERQLLLADKYDLPVIIHDREAHGDCFDMICRHPSVRGVFHSYSGSAEMARELVRRGWYVSFSGVITFKNAPRVRAAAAAVPHDRILIETDAPYLAPHPHRGKMNHSGLMLHTAEALAEVLGVSLDEAVSLTTDNAKRLFRL